jgi:hypothetical protein
MIGRLLFERLWLLATVLVTVQFILIAIWSWLRTRGAARGVWIGFGAIPILLILSVVVVTPRERIVAICRELAEATESKAIGVIGHYLSRDFEAGRLDRESFLARAEATLQRYSVHYPELRRFTITFPREGVGVAEFSASGQIESPESMYGWLTTRWRLTFRRQGDDWRVERVETIPVPPLNVGRLEDLLR